MDDLDMLPPLLIIIIAAAYWQQLRNRRKKRICWTQPWILRRQEHGAYYALMKELSQEDYESYRNFVRMTKKDFTELLEKVSPLIIKQDTIMRKSISPAERLSLTLRYLATGKILHIKKVKRQYFHNFIQTICIFSIQLILVYFAGESYKSLSYLYRIPVPTLSKIIPETCSAIYSSLKNEYLKVRCILLYIYKVHLYHPVHHHIPYSLNPFKLISSHIVGSVIGNSYPIVEPLVGN
jgi:hypothetical protein